ncbi:DnaJ family domain-containing protein [Pseudothauera rhizosphaerae]|uniref:DUF1992 domain-containing protein n=1 Tax=Pseudothauera rhizosphaerae TaxID=2565932 RepID=A0A4V3WBQ0_9RHOO|nr:DUF1992 domain-containing protein [Pseudothauera rhizosphaerae]THF64116.1 DUF1992 domain-containing protein [Pseudothauera rhizosphaerae]
MNVFDILAEQRILEALRRGELDGLPGAGRPLDLTEDPFVPPEQRMMNHVLRNAGVAPAEAGLRREIAALRAQIATLPAGEARDELRRRLAWLILQLGERQRG